MRIAKTIGLEIGLTKATKEDIAHLQSLMPTTDIIELASF